MASGFRSSTSFFFFFLSSGFLFLVYLKTKQNKTKAPKQIENMPITCLKERNSLFSENECFGLNDSGERCTCKMAEQKVPLGF